MGKDFVSFNVSKTEQKVIRKLAERAHYFAFTQGVAYDIQDAEMDLTACHANGCPLRLNDLLTADDFNFVHDVFGIRRNLDRETGKLDKFFSPRFHQR